MRPSILVKSFFLVSLLLTSKKAFAYGYNNFHSIFCLDPVKVNTGQASIFLRRLRNSCFPNQSQDARRDFIIEGVLGDFDYHKRKYSK